MKSAKKEWKGSAVVFAVVCAMILLGVTAAGAWDHHPRILPVQEEYYGKTYSEWAIEWWTWVLSFPEDSSPLFDKTGEFCAEGQKGPVWFLASTLGFSGGANPPMVRTCTVPFGKALFFPIINSVLLENVTNGNPDPEPQMRAYVECSVPTELAAEIDGVSVNGLYEYYEHSPIFDMKLPANNYLDTAPLFVPRNVDQGYYLFVRPLPPGKHTIHWMATWTCPFSTSAFSEDITYNLTIKGWDGWH